MATQAHRRTQAAKIAMEHKALHYLVHNTARIWEQPCTRYLAPTGPWPHSCICRLVLKLGCWGVEGAQNKANTSSRGQDFFISFFYTPEVCVSVCALRARVRVAWAVWVGRANLPWDRPGPGAEIR